MARPQTWLETTQCAKKSQQVVSSKNKKASFIPPLDPQSIPSCYSSQYS
jgi:hypothetical protein